ncbi:MAG: DUF3244 domain-containing protein [Paludibacter sp.]
MKKFNFLLSSILLILFFVIPFQNVLAVDVPLKPGDDSGSTLGGNKVLSTYSLLSTSTSTITETINAVTVDLTANELILNFNNQVGVAQISIVDQSGFIVYQDAVDTYSTSDLVIPVDTWESGKYTIKITYGTTSLSGSFRLY